MVIGIRSDFNSYTKTNYIIKIDRLSYTNCDNVDQSVTVFGELGGGAAVQQAEKLSCMRI